VNAPVQSFKLKTSDGDRMTDVVIVVCWGALAYITLELLKRAYLSIRDR
jgi:hypothetical protein